MELSQLRNGMWDVYEKGDWVGIAAQLEDGRYAFIGRMDDVLCIGLTLEGLAELIREDDESDD